MNSHRRIGGRLGALVFLGTLVWASAGCRGAGKPSFMGNVLESRSIEP
jgi:hypothetical protein